MSSRGVELRDVWDDDLATFFEHQTDPVATGMAGFPARDREAHLAHWHRIMGDTTVVAQTVLLDGEVAGNIVSWEQDGERNVGYWIGSSFWGKGMATEALAQFLHVVAARPLFAHVARHNVGSIRVLEKCGFTPVREAVDAGPDELILILRN